MAWSSRACRSKRFVDITSANAAKIFGLYPQKGAIAAGSDADVTIIDPSINKRLELSDLHLEDYSIWEGWPVSGWPVTTLLRGKLMVEDGRCSARPATDSGSPQSGGRIHQWPPPASGPGCQQA